MENGRKKYITFKMLLVLMILLSLIFCGYLTISLYDYVDYVSMVLRSNHTRYTSGPSVIDILDGTQNNLKTLAETTILNNVTMNREREQLTSSQKIVIILAYMHTGSTYLGSILQNHQESFYEYENLRSLMYSTRAGQVIHFLNGTNLQLLPNPDKLNVHHNVNPAVAADAIRKMLTCNHQDIDLATLANHYFSLKKDLNRHLQPFFSCQEKLYGKSNQLHAVSALDYVDNQMLENKTQATDIVRRCLPLLTDRCKQSKMVVEKFIRMTMEMAEILLQSFRNLKIVHLYRDPRAMLDSQVRKADSGAQHLSVFIGRAKYMCEQMLQDRKLAKVLEKKYPGQIYMVRYEDMVDLPMDTITNMFNFIEVNFTISDEVFVKGHSHRNDYSELHKPATLSTWRKHMKTEYLSIVDKYCSALYKELGYIKLSVSAIKDPRQIDHRSSVNK